MKTKMERRNTDNLRSELMDTPDLTTFLAANEDNFSSASAVARLNEMLEKKGLSKAALAKQSGMSEIYLHQIFAGRRNPSRSRMLCLCFGLSASLEETQELLRLCGLAELYPRVRRDAIIIYGLLHGMDLFAVNDRLFSEDEETLFGHLYAEKRHDQTKSTCLEGRCFLLFSSARRFLRALQCAPQRREEHEDEDRI